MTPHERPFRVVHGRPPRRLPLAQMRVRLPRQRTQGDAVPWLKIDDGFADHPKVDALSDGAFRLHVAGLCFCAKNTTDGVIPSHRVNRLTRTYKPTQLNELLRSGVWRKHPDGYEIHDYLEWNQSAEWWADKRAKDAVRKADWRRHAAERKAKEGSELRLLEGGVTT